MKKIQWNWRCNMSLTFEIKQDFIGKINNVEIHDKNCYYTMQYILQSMEDKFDGIEIAKDFILELYNTLERMYFKIEEFDYREVEKDFYCAIQCAVTPKDIQFTLFGNTTYLEDLNKEVKQLKCQDLLLEDMIEL